MICDVDRLLCVVVLIMVSKGGGRGLSIHPGHTQQQTILSAVPARSNVILQRTDALRGTDPILKEEPEALDGGAVGHPLGELGRVGAVHVDDGREAVGVVDVAAHAPAAARRLVLGAREERVQQLGRLRVRRVAQDRPRLRPADERAFGRVRHVVRRAARIAAAAGEGGGVCACEESQLLLGGLQGGRREEATYRWSCR